MMNRYESLRRNVVRKVRQVGIMGTVKFVIVDKLFDRLPQLVSPTTSEADPFDARYGTDTARIVTVGAMDIPDEQLEHATRYEAVVPSQFFDILAEIAIPHDRYVFVDIGSGKGRALLLASMFPFDEIIGVEHSAALTETARANIAIFKDSAQRCRKVNTVCADATAFAIPAKNTLLYLHNPFDGELMHSMVENVERSLRDSPRDIVVIYHKPRHRSEWDRSSCFDVVASSDLYVIYRSKVDAPGRLPNGLCGIAANAA